MIAEQDFEVIELTNKLSKGDINAFDKIYRKFNVKVYSFAYKNLKCKEDAEGIVQEVFINLWKDRNKLIEIKNLDAWIFSISFNFIRKHIRELIRERKNINAYHSSISINNDSTSVEIEYQDLLKNTERIIERLPPKQKAVFILSRSNGLNISEISKKLHISEKTARNYLASALRLIKNDFLKEDIMLVFFLWVSIC